MSGIYIHIPFCRKKCNYCNFHFSTRLSHQSEMIEAICLEIIKRKKYLPSNQINTIYFGGGTPSLLTSKELKKIISTISENFNLHHDSEITLEANPEDLSLEKCYDFKNLGINRLSIGIQSFDDSTLKWMNRQHTQKQSIDTYNHARCAGFENISVDLIYALPTGTNATWENTLKKTITLAPNHIAVYGLTIEEKTVFGHKKKNYQFTELSEENAAQQFIRTMEVLENHGYRQYEISSFEKGGYYSQHNYAYWQGKPYLGIGPGAHSYDRISRQHNIPNNIRYIKRVKNGDDFFFEKEMLSDIDMVNEFILTRLRTDEGLDYRMFNIVFGKNLLQDKFLAIEMCKNNELIIVKDNTLRLTWKGILVADEVILKLCYE